MIGILCPVLNRPQYARTFYESARGTRSEYKIYFICSPGDEEEIAACRATDAVVLVAPFRPGPADFAKKINWAFDETDEEWLFQAADDIRFSPKWDAHALATALRKNALVVGTNDLGNPSVKRGRHSTHTLFRRSYIEEYGGTIDGSGKVFSELYDHQWTDNEFIQTAMHRRVFAFSRNSLVEHLHPHWGKGEMDETYEKATRSSKDDMLLFKERFRLIQAMTRQEKQGAAR